MKGQRGCEKIVSSEVVIYVMRLFENAAKRNHLSKRWFKMKKC